MEENNKIKKGKKYLVIGILVLFLSILGASVSYYLARVQGTLTGRAAGMDLELTITKLSTSATDDLIPLDNDLETLNLASLGYGNNSEEFDASKACIDINGYSVCQIYKVRVSNNGNVPVVVNGTVSLAGANTPNIDCAKMDDEVTVTNNASCMGQNVLASGVTLPADNHLDYYIMVYINNLDEPQYDSGEFNGTVVFTSTDGKKVKGRFNHSYTAVQYITSLYTSANKTTAITNSGTYNYATSVNLMNDRLGNPEVGINAGNIRYYGSSPNNWVDIGDKYETSVTQGNWESWFDGSSDISTTEDCLDWVEERTNYSAESPDSGESNPTISNTYGKNKIVTLSNQITNNDFKLSLLGKTTLIDWNNIMAVTGYETSEEFCSISTIPAGTPILYRIIGIFGDNLKIIRDKSIGVYSWDVSLSSVSAGHGVNEWSQADLMKLLNPGHDTNTDYDNDELTEITVNNSLWWNSESGICYKTDGATSTCDFTNIGLSENAKHLIVDNVWYLGGADYESEENIYVNECYNIERGNGVIQNPSDGVNRTTRWTGKVGLIYASDYGYATDLDSCDQYLGDYGDSSNCTENNWLKTGYPYWTISPDLTDESFVRYITAMGHLNSRPATAAFPDYKTRPTMYIDSDAIIESGTGTQANPYIITD